MRKLICVAFGYTSALIASHYFIETKWLPAFAAGAAILALAALFLRGSVRIRALIFCLAAAVGFIWTWGNYLLFIKPADSLVGQEQTVTVRVIDYPELNEDYSRMEVLLIQDGLPKTQMYVYDYNGGFDELKPGDIVRIQLKFISATQKFEEKIDYYISDGVYAKSYLTGEYELTGRWNLHFLTFPKIIGHVIKEQTLLSFPEDMAPLMKALLTGDKAELFSDDSIYSALKASGFIHIIAVSGMHVSFLISMLRLGTGRRRITAFIGIPLILVFMSMVGFPASAVRAGIMMIITLLAPLLDREYDPPTGLAAALLLLLIINPQAIGNIGLQLSFASMAGIIFISPRVYDWSRERLKNIKRQFLRKPLNAVANAFASSIGAIVFTTPLSALYFGFVPLYSLVTNLLCLWAMSMAFMLGYFVCLAGLVWGALGSCLGWCLAWLPRYVVFIIGHISALPFAVLYTSNNYVAWWLVFVYAVFIGCYITKKREIFRPLLPLCLCVFTFTLIFFLQAAERADKLSVTALDTGQGQCIIALTERGTVVIDCGGTNSPINAGEAAEEYLRSHGRGSIDLLILTHFHKDHANGVKRLMSTMEVKRIAIPEKAENTEYSNAIISLAQEQQTELYYIQHDSIVSIDDLELTVYAPLGSASANEQGLMVYGSCGEFDFLVTGDAGIETEKILTVCYELPDIELLICGHHGSKHASGEALLDEVTPETAFISVGYNTYGHPAQETIDRLSERGIEVYRTDLSGNITFAIGKDYDEEG